MSKAHWLVAVLLIVGTALAQQVNLSGTVTDATTGNPVMDAFVAVKSLEGYSTRTDANGNYQLFPMQLHVDGKCLGSGKSNRFSSRMIGNSIAFTVNEPMPVAIEIFSLSGSRIQTVFKDANVLPGTYMVNLVGRRLATTMHIVRAQYGSRTAIYQFAPTAGGRGQLYGQIGSATSGSLAKLTAADAVDTLIFAANGYDSLELPISSYTGSYNAALQPCGLPVIVTQPTAQCLIGPATATFSLIAAGTNLSYQWQVARPYFFGNVSTGTGEKTPSYTTAATGAADDGAVYRCVVTDSCGFVVSNSAKLSVTTTSTPETPTGISASRPSNTSIAIVWLATSGAASYNVYGSNSSTGIFRLVGTATSNSYTVNGVFICTAYYYKISAQNCFGESPASGCTLVPAILTLIPGDGQMTIVWKNDSSVTSYNLYWVQGSDVTEAAPNRVAGATRPYVISGLTNDLVYSFGLTAVRSGVESNIFAVGSGQPHTTRTLGGMRQIVGGTFMMGFNYYPEVTGAYPPHSVTVSDFWIDSTDVTQQDYQQIMGSNPSSDTGDLNRPVEMVTWFDAVLYCNSRSKAAGLDTVYSYTSVSYTPVPYIISVGGCTDLGNIAIDYTKHGYRLPTEAEWEYAYRAGTTTEYFWGDDTSLATLSLFSWNLYNSNGPTHPVATRLPNQWGLYDMCGNVFQWCNDWYDSFATGAQTDPVGPGTSFCGQRMMRGGSSGHLYPAQYMRSSDRGGHALPYEGLGYNGFRCVRR